MPIRCSAKKLLSKAAWSAYNSYRKGLFYRSQLTEATSLFNSSRETILKFQLERLKQLIAHAINTTPYYQNLSSKIGINQYDLLDNIKSDRVDITAIPPLKKQIIQNQVEQLCSELYSSSQRILNATGGSTGNPLKFFQDRHYWNNRNLSVYYFDRWGGWDFGEPQLIIWGASADFSSNLKHKLNSLLRNQHWLNSYQLTDAAMWYTYWKMEKFQPQTILSYPSSLYQFAKYIVKNDLRPTWKLKGIISSAEMLLHHYRTYAEKVFDTKIYNRYGSREVGLIAMECVEGRMHINCRDLYLEIESPDPYTEPGEILITQLNNYVMPFIRYKIGDIGLLSDEMCPCGNELPILDELLGRSTATFRTQTGTLIHGGYFTQQFYKLTGVTQFQLIQESYDKCVLKLVTNEQWTESIGNIIVQKIREVLGSDVSVKLIFLDEIPLSKSGKIEYTISKIT